MNRKSIFGIVAVVALIAVAMMFVRPQISGDDNSGKKVVLTTFTVLADMAQNVAGDVVVVESLTRAGAEIHNYEPTPSDLVRAQRADLILDNGLNLELWATKLYESIPDVEHVRLSEGVEPIGITEGPYKDRANPHAWMSPRVALQYVENIRKALTALSPEHAELFAQNAKIYSEEIRALDARLKKEISEVPEATRYITSCEGAFSYLAQDYGLNELYLWPINSDANGTPQQIAHVVDVVKEQKIPTVFCESTVNTKGMEQVAKETGAEFGGVFYVDSLSGVDGPAPTYIKMLTYNVDILLAGWK